MAFGVISIRGARVVLMVNIREAVAAAAVVLPVLTRGRLHSRPVVVVIALAALVVRKASESKIAHHLLIQAL